MKDKYPDYDTYLSDWHGEEGGTQGYWTNPKAKWDWYSLGGRWTGYFKLKPEATSHAVGKPGLMTPSAKRGYADQCLKKYIDIDFMRIEAKKEAEINYDLAQSVIKGRSFESWDDVRNRFEKIDEARDFYHAQEICVDWKESKEIGEKLGFMSSPSDYSAPRDKFIEHKVNTCVTPFALIKDGEWHQRGEMGWWGCVSDENNDWDTQFTKLFDSISEDTQVSLYDCHI